MQNQIVNRIATSILEIAPTNLFSQLKIKKLLHTTYVNILTKACEKHPSLDESTNAMLANNTFEIDGKYLLSYIHSDGTGTRPEGAHWDPIVSKLKAAWKPDKTIVHPAGASSSPQAASGAGASGSASGASSSKSSKSSKSKPPKTKPSKKAKGKTPQGGSGPIEKVSAEDEALLDRAIAEKKQGITHNRKDVLDFLSDEPICLIPKDEDGNPLYPLPPRSHTQSWRPINGILSGLKKGSVEQTILAHAWMYSHYEKPKQFDIFKEFIPEDATDKDGNPYDEAGGPFLADRRSYCPHPDNLGEHTEVVVYGEMQSSKSPETAAQAHTCAFFEGLLPCIFVRARGGAEVGSVDMKGAVEAYNADFKEAIGEILPHYGFSPEIDYDKWAARRDKLAVRCTSPNPPPTSRSSLQTFTLYLPFPNVIRFSLNPKLTSKQQTLSFNTLGELDGGNQGQQASHLSHLAVPRPPAHLSAFPSRSSSPARMWISSRSFTPRR
tara:strand:+ start:101 stop:1582 length:1482 start_codon:yes stop_codon:yes gene_type:complete